MSPLLRIEGLVLEARTPRGTARILRGIDLTLERGRILGLVGESGSGKSSLGTALLRLLPSNVSRLEGRIELDGTDLLTLSDAEVERFRGGTVAMIFQDPMSALNPVFTIGTLLADVAMRNRSELGRSEARAVALGALKRVAIADPEARLDQYPHELSGGMRQRVMIAMALLCRPKLLVADEPTTALDATVEAQIVELIANLRNEMAGGVLFISHQLGLVASLCDDLAVLYAGTLVETGPMDAVLARPRHPYTAALLACEIPPDGEGRLASIPGDVPDPFVVREGCVFAPRCPHAAPVCEAPTRLREAGAGQASACTRFEEVT